MMEWEGFLRAVIAGKGTPYIYII
jgi:hypothetical protein